MEIPDGYAQANLRFTGLNAPTGAECTIGLDVTGFAGTPAEAAEEVADAWNASGLDNRQMSDIALTSVLVKFGPVATGPSGLWTGSIPGTQAVDGLAPNTSMLFQKQTAFGGRAGRGRMYVPGVPENGADDSGDLTSAFVAAASSAGASFLLLLDTAQLPAVLLHSATSPISSPTPIQALVCDTRVATQRRRLRR